MRVTQHPSVAQTDIPDRRVAATAGYSLGNYAAMVAAGEGAGSAEPLALAERLAHLVRSGVLLKLGSRGAFLAAKDGLRQPVAALRVKAVDTTAAGDAFNGAFAVGWMMGKTPAESAAFAAAASAVSVTRAGAQPSMATIEEVERLRAATGG